MLDEKEFFWIGSDVSAIPHEALPELRSFVLDGLGNKFSLMLPKLAYFFPRMVNVLVSHWSLPKLGLIRTVRGNWGYDIVLQRDNSTCYFKITPNYIVEMDDFDEYYRPLPDFWKELYRDVESFQVTQKSVPEFHYWNTPFRGSARLDLDEYAEGSGASKSQVKAFAKKVGCRYDALRCWLLTENEDALFLDEEHCDHKVYHVRGKALDDIYVLPDAQKTLDAYFAHFLSGGKPADFDFRAPVA
jgi:hypothetical protein